MKKIVLIFLLAVVATSLYSQKYPERRFVRSGNSSYEKGNYSGSEAKYIKALKADSTSYEAAFNYGNSLYKQERFDEANKVYGKLMATDSTNLIRRSASSYNMGNSLFGQRQLEQALEAYKSAMRANPNDQQAKFNYAYTKKLLEEKSKDKDKDKDKNKDKDNKEGQNDKKDQNQEPKDDKKEKDDKGDPKKNKQDQQQPKPEGMDKGQADQMLKAVQMSEDKTREKVEQENAHAVGVGSMKNW